MSKEAAKNTIIGVVLRRILLVSVFAFFLLPSLALAGPAPGFPAESTPIGSQANQLPKPFDKPKLLPASEVKQKKWEFDARKNRRYIKRNLKKISNFGSLASGGASFLEKLSTKKKKPSLRTWQYWTALPFNGGYSRSSSHWFAWAKGCYGTNCSISNNRAYWQCWQNDNGWWQTTCDYSGGDTSYWSQGWNRQFKVRFTATGAESSTTNGTLFDWTSPSAWWSNCRGTGGSNGWHISDITCTANHSDNIGLKAISHNSGWDYSTSGEGGNKGMTVSVTDHADLGASSYAGTWSVDKTDPSASITGCSSPNGSNSWYTSLPTCTVSGSDGVSGIWFVQTSTDNANWTNVNNNSTWQPSADGTPTLYFRPYDWSGRAGWTSQQVKLDRADPSSSITGCASPNGSNSWYTSAPTCTLSASDATSGVATVQRSTDNANWTTVTSGSTWTPSVGTATVYLKATDNAGRVSSTSSQQVKLDTDNPSVSITGCSSPNGSNSWYTSAPTCTLSASDSTAGIATIERSTDNANWTTITSGSTWTPPEGTTTLYLRATDNAGRTATVSQQVKLDTANPSSPSVSLSSKTGSNTHLDTSNGRVYIDSESGKSGTFTLQGSASDSTSGVASVAFPALSGITAGTLSGTSPHSVTYSWSNNPTEGAGAKTVTATDNAGRQTSNSSAFTLVKDTAAPTGGALTINGSAVSSSGTKNATSYNISGSIEMSARSNFAEAMDASGSGLLSSTLKRQSATLTADNCGAFSDDAGYTNITSSTFTQGSAEGIQDGKCYKYILTGIDNVSNTDSIEVTVKVDTTLPSLTLQQAAGQQDPSASAPIKFNFSADEALKGSSIVQSDFTITNGDWGGAEARRNYVTNPSFETDAANWVTYSGTTLARSANGGFTDPGNGAMTAIAGAAARGINLATAIEPASTVGDIWSASAYVKADAGKTLTLQFIGRDSGGVAVESSQTNFVGTGSWELITVSRNITNANTVRVDLALGDGSDDDGAHTFYVDGALLEKSPSAGRYFDGSGYIDDSGTWVSSNNKAVWMGTAHASQSQDNSSYDIYVSSPANGEVQIAPSGTFSVEDLAGNVQTSIASGSDRFVWFGAPINDQLPAISGTQTTGFSLSTSSGAWRGDPTSLDYQWQRCDSGVCQDISGETGTTYTLLPIDAGKTIRVKLTATNQAGAKTVFSLETEKITRVPLNTAIPSISGQVALGQTLTALDGTWEAYPAPTFTYQWQRCDGEDCQDISGATSATYDIGDSDKGLSLKVLVVASNSAGDEEALSEATVRVPFAPEVVSNPTISGIAAVRESLSTNSPGVWRGYPAPTFTYQWQRCAASCQDISGATSSGYAPAEDDIGKRLRVVVTASNSEGALAQESALSEVVGKLPTNDSLPSISGDLLEGATLSGNAGAWSGSPSPTLDYQWERCQSDTSNCQDIQGATNTSYQPVRADISKKLRFRVRGINSYNQELAWSALTSPIAGAPWSIEVPSISGTLSAGEILEADPGVWGGYPEPTYSYQWQSCTDVCEDITGADHSAYTVRNTDGGKRIRLVVRAENSVGFASKESSISTTVIFAPENVSRPFFVSAPRVGEVFAASNGSWEAVPEASFSYQWERCLLQDAASSTFYDPEEDVRSLTSDRADSIYALLPGSVLRFNNGTPQTIASPGGNLQAMEVDRARRVFIIDAAGERLLRALPGQEAAPLATVGEDPRDLAIDSYGHIFVANAGDNNITKVTPEGRTSLISLPANSQPDALVIDDNNNLFVASRGLDKVFKITPDGTVSVFASVGDAPSDITIDANGRIYTANSLDDTVSRISTSGTSSVLGSTGQEPVALEVNSLGAVFVANKQSGDISRISPGGTSSIVDSAGASPADLTLDSLENIYAGGLNIISKITRANCSTISGANAQTYTPASEDSDYKLRVLVQATNVQGSSSAWSLISDSVKGAPENTAAPSISGQATVGGVLDVDYGSWRGSPYPTFTYQWQRCDGGDCQDITDATDNSYQPVRLDVGKTLRARVNASNTEGATSVISSPSEVIKGAPVLVSSPSVSGNALVSAELSTTNGAWEAYPAPTFTYQWQRCEGGACQNIQGATSSSYTIADSIKGATVRVRVTASNSEGGASGFSSQTAVVNKIPVNTSLPVISGPAAVGSTVGTSTGSWSAYPEASFTYQWQRCQADGSGCQNIPGATEESYTVAAENVGLRLKAIVSASNSSGSAFAASQTTARVTDQPGLVSNPSISGTLVVSAEVQASPGSWSGYPAPAFIYQWQRCQADSSGCQNIPGATGSSYILKPDDQGQRIRVRVVAENSSGSKEAFSPITSQVAPDIKAPPSNNLLPTVSGLAETGQTLQAFTGTWSGFPEPSFDYQWQYSDGGTWKNIPDANSSQYSINQKYVSSILRVRIRAYNSSGVTFASSAPTGQVAGAPVNTAAPGISGQALPGEPLTVSNGVWLSWPEATYSYQWQRSENSIDWEDIVGQTGSTYTPLASDRGKLVRVRVRATNTIREETVTSDSYTRALGISDIEVTREDPIAYDLIFEDAHSISGLAANDLQSAGSEGFAPGSQRFLALDGCSAQMPVAFDPQQPIDPLQTTGVDWDCPGNWGSFVPQLKANSVQDAASNAGPIVDVSGPEVLVDRNKPTLQWRGTPDNPTATVPFTFLFSFDDEYPVSNLQTSQFSNSAAMVPNPAGNLEPLSNCEYSIPAEYLGAYTINPGQIIPLTVDCPGQTGVFRPKLAAGSVIDQAGNSINESEGAEIIIDKKPPEASWINPPDSPRRSTVFSYTLRLEDHGSVFNIDADDFEFGGDLPNINRCQITSRVPNQGSGQDLITIDISCPRPESGTYQFWPILRASSIEDFAGSIGPVADVQGPVTVFDYDAPTGGALTVNNVAATSQGSWSAASSDSFPFVKTSYADPSAPINEEVSLQFAPMEQGSCAEEWAASVFNNTNPQVVSSSGCYRYKLEATDAVGNSASIFTTVRVDLSPPQVQVSLANPVGSTYIKDKEVFYAALDGRSGGFRVLADASDPDSTIDSVLFPTISDMSGGMSDTLAPFSATYTWSGVSPSAFGQQTVRAFNSMGLSGEDSFQLVKDSLAPEVSWVNQADDPDLSCTGNQQNGWYREDPICSWKVVDNISGIKELEAALSDGLTWEETDNLLLESDSSSEKRGSVSVAGEGEGIAVRLRARDQVDTWSEWAVKSGIKIDRTNPQDTTAISGDYIDNFRLVGYGPGYLRLDGWQESDPFIRGAIRFEDFEQDPATATDSLSGIDPMATKCWIRRSGAASSVEEYTNAAGNIVINGTPIPCSAPVYGSVQVRYQIFDLAGNSKTSSWRGINVQDSTIELNLSSVKGGQWTEEDYLSLNAEVLSDGAAPLGVESIKVVDVDYGLDAAGNSIESSKQLPDLLEGSEPWSLDCQGAADCQEDQIRLFSEGARTVSFRAFGEPDALGRQEQSPIESVRVQIDASEPQFDMDLLAKVRSYSSAQRELPNWKTTAVWRNDSAYNNFVRVQGPAQDPDLELIGINDSSGAPIFQDGSGEVTARLFYCKYESRSCRRWLPGVWSEVDQPEGQVIPYRDDEMQMVEGQERAVFEPCRGGGSLTLKNGQVDCVFDVNEVLTEAGTWLIAGQLQDRTGNETILPNRRGSTMPPQSNNQYLRGITRSGQTNSFCPIES